MKVYVSTSQAGAAGLFHAGRMVMPLPSVPATREEAARVARAMDLELEEDWNRTPGREPR